MKESILRRELRLACPPAVVFPFFSDAQNLQVLTPPWLDFKILNPAPVAMRTGALIHYRLRIHGLPLRWVSEITVWNPPHCFVDEQRRGPYRRWIHEHRFEPCGPGTVCVDHVRYAVPGGRWVDKLFVKRDLDRIFDFRHEKLAALFAHGPDHKPD